jgi:glycerophosphoryl diester phosphodiesterase
MIMAVLKRFNLHTVESSQNKLPIILQSFEEDALKKFSTLTDLPLVQLISYTNPNYPPLNLTKISEYAHGVGPESSYIFYYKEANFNPNTESQFIKEAHSL